MKFYSNKETLLPTLLSVGGVVEKKQTMPVMSNFLLRLEGEQLTVTATDSEIEITANCLVETKTPGIITVPAKKLIDICRNLEDNANIELSYKKDGQALLTSGRGRYRLQTLPPEEFPNLDNIDYQFDLNLAQYQLKSILKRTQFAMALEDVRYYINGLLLSLSANTLTTVATDGHRLSLSKSPINFSSDESFEFLLPRKAVLELFRIIPDSEELITCHFAEKHVSFSLPNLIFTTKLIDSQFANYSRVIPEKQTCENIVEIDRLLLSQAINRVSILSQKKLKGINLVFSQNTLRLESINTDNEEAVESVDIIYSGKPFNLTFNAVYVLDFLNSSNTDTIKLFTGSQNASTLLEDNNNSNHQYVIMPMKA
jgi:DNA polymerase III subunit beta